MGKGVWVYVGSRAGNKPSPKEKKVVSSACDTFIAERLMPKFLPEIRPTEFNYPIAISGKWRGNKYTFLTRYKSDDPRSLEPEFDAPFARLGYISRDLFDLSWRRHTGEWIRMFDSVSLVEALRLIETETFFAPC